jgi:hypothetical protein
VREEGEGFSWLLFTSISRLLGCFTADHHCLSTACSCLGTQQLAWMHASSCWHLATASLAHIWDRTGLTSSFFFPTATDKLLI